MSTAVLDRSMTCCDTGLDLPLYVMLMQPEAGSSPHAHAVPVSTASVSGRGSVVLIAAAARLMFSSFPKNDAQASLCCAAVFPWWALPMFPEQVSMSTWKPATSPLGTAESSFLCPRETEALSRLSTNDLAATSTNALCGGSVTCAAVAAGGTGFPVATAFPLSSKRVPGYIAARSILSVALQLGFISTRPVAKRRA